MNPHGRHTNATLQELGELLSATARGAMVPEYSVIAAATRVEGYTDRLLQSMVRASRVDQDPFGRALLSEVRDSMYSSWPERLRWLATFGVEVAGTRAWHDMDTLIDLRNALVHGGGQLTARQSRELPKLLALEARLDTTLSVRVEGLRLRLGVETPRLATLVAADFVRALDAAASALAG